MIVSKKSATVVIPAYNPDMHFFAQAIRAMAEYSAPLIDQVIVVDDESPAPIEFKQEDLPKGVSVKVVRQKNKGPGGARNFGSQFARTPVLVFIDSDCMPTSEWVGPLVRPILDGKYVGVGGTVLTFIENNKISKFADFRELLRRPVKNAQGKITNVITANSAFSKQVFDEVGGFTESKVVTPAEDVDFTYKLIAHGYQKQLGYASDSVVEHRHRTNLKAFIRQQYKYGFGAMRHCQYRQRPLEEIGIVAPKPLSVLKLVVLHAINAIKLTASADGRYSLGDRYIYFPALEFVRKLSYLAGHTAAYYRKHNFGDDDLGSQ